MPTSIHSFPTEILSQIFVLHVDNYHQQFLIQTQTATDAEGMGNLVRELAVAPYIFLQICRRWHDIALWEPHLWTRMAVQPSEREHLPSFLSAMRDAVARAGPLHLDLIFYDPPPFMLKSPSTNSQSLYHTIVEFFPRCRSITLVMRNRWDDIVAAMPFSALPHLVDITLKLDSALIGYGDPFIRELLERSVKLQSYAVSVSGDDDRGAAVMCSGSLQETHIMAALSPTFRHIFAPDSVIDAYLFMHLLQGYPLLETFVLDTVDADENCKFNGDRLVHTHLSRLDIRYMPESGADDLLDFLTLPALTSLRYVRGNDDENLLPSHSTTSFFQRSQCQLTELALCGYSPGTGLVDILHSQKLLRQLELRYSTYSCVPNDALAALQVVCPALEEATLSVCVTQFEVIEKVLQKRIRGGVRARIPKSWRLQVNLGSLDVPPEKRVATRESYTRHLSRFEEVDVRPAKYFV